LAIVETLKEFRNILLGQKIIVHTNHKNLTHQTFKTERVMRWRLIIKEYGPEFLYIKGEHNIVADALSRLIITPVSIENTSLWLAEGFAVSEEKIKEVHSSSTYPQKASTSSYYNLNAFRGGGKTLQLIYYKRKIVIPKSLQKNLAE
jgi:hypothetical protein